MKGLGGAAREEASVLDGLPKAETAGEGVLDTSSHSVVHLEALKESKVGALRSDVPLSSKIRDNVVLLADDASLLDAVVNPLRLIDEVRGI